MLKYGNYYYFEYNLRRRLLHSKLVNNVCLLTYEIIDALLVEIALLLSPLVLNRWERGVVLVKGASCPSSILNIIFLISCLTFRIILVVDQC